MAELKCVVENCTYNNDKCCCKGDIMVGGKEAQKENDTCCESFKDRTGESASNAMNPCRTISIDCEAVKCVYNTITSAMRSMWTSRAAAPVTAVRQPVLPLRKDKL